MSVPLPILGETLQMQTLQEVMIERQRAYQYWLESLEEEMLVVHYEDVMKILLSHIMCSHQRRGTIQSK